MTDVQKDNEIVAMFRESFKLVYSVVVESNTSERKADKRLDDIGITARQLAVKPMLTPLH